MQAGRLLQNQEHVFSDGKCAGSMIVSGKRQIYHGLGVLERKNGGRYEVS
jgi:hypothetical protein